MRYCAVVSTRHGSSCFDPSHFQVSLGWSSSLLANGAWKRGRRRQKDASGLGCRWYCPEFGGPLASGASLRCVHELGGDLIVVCPARGCAAADGCVKHGLCR